MTPTSRGLQRFLALYFLILTVVAFWPSPVDGPVHGTLAVVFAWLHGHNVPGWFNYGFVEAAANVLLFIPLGVLAALSMPGKRTWQIAALGLAISGGMELGQLLFLGDRMPSPLEIITNTSGTVPGTLALRCMRRRRAAEHRMG